MYVVDASVLVPFVLAYGKNAKRILLTHRLHILDLTCYEVCNAFWKECMKLQRISRKLASEACVYFMKLTRYTTVHRLLDLNVDDVIDIALTNNITVYDASYIALAKKLRAPIASNDRDILDTAPKYSIQVYDLDGFLKTVTA